MDKKAFATFSGDLMDKAGKAIPPERFERLETLIDSYYKNRYPPTLLRD